jgi:spermidine synthase
LERTPQTAQPHAIDRLYLLCFAVFFTSGMAGLIYQVVWSRMLALVIGVTIFAVTVVVCTFMGGLGLGAYLVGRHGRRLRNPLRAYGIIEAVVGAYALLTPWIFDSMQPAYAAAGPIFGPLGLNIFRIVLSASLLLIPTTLMGATLPLLARAVSEGRNGGVQSVGLLYSVNTFGAVAGCLVAGFFLLAQFGIRDSIYVAGAMNLSIAALTLVASNGLASSVVDGRSAVDEEKKTDRQGRFVLLVFFASGFAALGYELLWTRALLVHLRSSTYAFSLMLSVYLLGIALGSLVAARFAERTRAPLKGVAVCQIGVAGAVFISLLTFPDLKEYALALTGLERLQNFSDALRLMFSQAAIILLLPTIFMGAMFPLVVKAYNAQHRRVERSVGVLYAVNTAGNIAGSVAVGFISIELIGVRNSMLALVALNLGLAAIVLMRDSVRPGIRWSYPVAALAALAFVHLTVSPHIFLDSMSIPSSHEIIHYREGASDTVVVTESPQGRRTLIYADGRGAAGTWTLRWNLYFGHLPMLLHQNPKEILHICFGSGNSVLALTRHDPDRVDAVELSPHVRETAKYFWTNESVLDDPRVNLITEDGRNYVLRTRNEYDVVSMEPPLIHAAGIINLYTVEFYEEVREHLKPGGVMVQWLPTSTLLDSDRAHLMAAFVAAFPHVYVWQQLETTQLLLVGTLQPLEVDFADVDRRLRSDALKHDAEIMETPGAAEFLSYFKLGDESARALVKGVVPVTDDHSIVDYSIPLGINSAFGLSYRHPLGEEGYSHSLVNEELLSEYDEWHDPVSLIVLDPDAAVMVENEISRRKKLSPIAEKLRRRLKSNERRRARQAGSALAS